MVTLKVQRSGAELRENGVTKRHLPFPFSAHPPEAQSKPSFIHGGICKADMGGYFESSIAAGDLKSGLLCASGTRLATTEAERRAKCAHQYFHSLVARPLLGA